jgi:hypothetical protein
MPGNRLAQETTLTVSKAAPADLCEYVNVLCSAGNCEFIWIVEDDDGDSIDLPKFCPMCGRRAAE